MIWPLLVPHELDALLVARQLFLHFADGLSEQHLRLLDAVQDRVKIGAEQARYACDKCHGFPPYLAI